MDEMELLMNVNTEETQFEKAQLRQSKRADIKVQVPQQL